MFKNIFLAVLIVTSIIIFSIKTSSGGEVKGISGAPPYGEFESEVPDTSPLALIKDWKRPEGPAKVALQIGHYKNDEVPEELKNLKNSTGASGGGKWEWEINYEIARLIADILMEDNVVVEILPATVPPKYWADVFMAIHADGSEDKNKSGYKFAGPWRDYTQKSNKLVSILEEYYEATGLVKDENVTRDMRGYYAFSWWKYEYAVHPMTTAVIAETGFLTNRKDQKLLINNPEIAADAIAEAILEYLKLEKVL